MNLKHLYVLVILFVVVGSAIAKEKNVSQLIVNLSGGKEQTVVAYGTSLTEKGSWVKEVEEALDSKYPKKIKVVNSGGSGKWSKWGIENLEKRVLVHKPDTVFLEFSVNDCVERFDCSVEKSKNNLEVMIERIYGVNPKCEIILMTMTPGNGDPNKRKNIAQYYEIYREVAKTKKIKLIDHYPNWIELQLKDKKLFDSLVPDSVHPTEEGCAKMVTPTILKAIGFKK